jgi:hypothetical protein
MRVLAQGVREPDIKARMLQVAEDYDLLAERAVQRAR